MASAIGEGRGPARGRPGTARRQGTPGHANPAFRQRELGQRLRELRNARGMTVEEVGAELLCSATKISRLETGARRASLRDVRDLCRVYGVEDPAELMSLARQALEPGWWSQYGDLKLDPYIGLEQEAVSITSYSMYYVPSLLQSAEYARSVIRAIERKMDVGVIEERVEVRIRRQELLERANPPRYRALIDEAVLHREIGGPSIMRDQLEKIRSLMLADLGSIQVIPFTAGGHASADSNFDLLEFGEKTRQEPVVYVEGLVGALYLKRPAEVARYLEAIEYLRDAALNTRDTLALVTRIRDRYSGIEARS